MFTPPSVRNDDPNGKKGSIVLPGVYGGGNWNNGAFDPETGMYYAVSHTVPWVYDLVKPTDPKATMDTRSTWAKVGHRAAIPTSRGRKGCHSPNRRTDGSPHTI